MTTGQVVGRYRLVTLLGSGGMGAVYEAVHTGTGKRAAVKVLSTTGHELPAESIARFRREVRAVGSIDSQHIVQIYDAGRDEVTGLPFMAMELLSGETVESLCRRAAPIAPEAALRIAGQVCLGLSRAHEVGVIHRDIKPANLFLVETDSGEHVVKILDFGIAKVNPSSMAQTATDNALTETGSMLGSPHYMSPEQALGEKHIDHRTDIWSLGCVLYKLLTGRAPYGDCDSLGQVIAAILSVDPPHVQDIAPWVPPEVAAVVHGALRRRAADRYPSCEAMLEAIREIVGGYTLHAKLMTPPSAEERARVAERYARPSSSSPPTLTAAPARSGSLDPSTTAGTSETSPRARRRLLSWGLGVAVAAGAGWLALRASRPEPLEAPHPVAVSTPTSHAAALTAPDAISTVRVAIEPPTASVEVDGTSVPVRDGAIEIGGGLGSVHRVRARSEQGDVSVDVVVTRGGPMPSRIAVPLAPPRAALAAPRPRPAVTHSAAPSKTGAVTAPVASAAPAQTGARMQPTTHFE